ncbi:helix-turn-helix domain-containing protein [Orbaceae bacterium ESL0721]|nr:helix-turn-helix domain-containing protein [Orbaceae bacterium ESL0721]
MREISKSIRSNSYSISCELCSLSPICIPLMLNHTANSIIECKRLYAKDEVLINKGEPFANFYIINSGALKSYEVAQDNSEQINGFYLPGDIVGLDSIYTKKYNKNVKALTNTKVCEIHYSEFMLLVDKNRKFRDLVFHLLSNDIYNYQKLILFYSQKRAEARLAFFIYSIYSRYEQQGHTSLNIKLSMSRADIANYLGLTIETISRILSKFQEQQILLVTGKYIFIKDLDALVSSGE